MIILENDINEFSDAAELIYIDNQYRILAVYNESKEPYFKLYSGSIPFYCDDKDTKMCRISMVLPKYIGGKDENLILTKSQIDDLNKILVSKPINCKPYNSKNTVWEAIIFELNYQMKNGINGNHEYDFDDLQMAFPIPDYYNLLPKKGK